MAATNLYQYYTSQGKTLPSVSELAPVYEKYGLGNAGSYSGTAAQNTALLNKLTGNPGGYASMQSAPSGGYNQTPSGNPQPITNDPGINDLTSWTAQNRADREALIKRQNEAITGAWNKVAGETGLNDKAATLAQIESDLAGTGVKMADVPLQVNEGVRGTFANDVQRQTEIGSDLVPLQALYTKVATALPGASTAYQTAMQSTQAQVQQINDAMARELSGFDESSQNELAALQAKVARGQKLTDQQFERATNLMIAQKQYDAQIASANIGAGATLGSAALAHPGLQLTKGPDGTYSAKLPDYLNPNYAGPLTPTKQNARNSANQSQNITPQAVQGALNKYSPSLAGGNNATISSGSNRSSSPASGIGYGVDSNGFTLYPDGSRVKDDPFNPKAHGA